MKLFYLLAAIAGAVIPWIYNLKAINEIGPAFTPAAFMRVGFEGSAMLGSLAADFWIGSTVAVVWMIVEARRLGIKHLWLLLLWTVMGAWASSFPLFLFLRERKLELQRASATGA